jgi:predicted nucleotidyltransferase
MVLEMLSPQEMKILDRLIAAFSTLAEVEEILVFGSRARGRANDGSDMDIVVLVSNKNPALLKQIQSLKWNALEDPEDFIYVNIFPVQQVEYSKGQGLFYANLKSEAISIWKRKSPRPSK